MAANSARDACRSTGMCGRAPGTVARYRLRIGARSLTGTSTRRQGRAWRPCRMVTSPSAARTLRTQLQFSPSIGTRYHSPCQSAMPSGNRVSLPVRRPATSSVTQRRGARPALNTAAHTRANRRAAALPRPPAYIPRTAVLDNGQLPNFAITSSSAISGRDSCGAVPGPGHAPARRSSGLRRGCSRTRCRRRTSRIRGEAPV